MTTESKKIIDKLNSITEDLNYIKKHMVDVDIVLTDDDLQALDEAEEDLKSGKAVRL